MLHAGGGAVSIVRRGRSLRRHKSSEAKMDTRSGHVRPCPTGGLAVSAANKAPHGRQATATCCQIPTNGGGTLHYGHRSCMFVHGTDRAHLGLGGRCRTEVNPGDQAFGAQLKAVPSTPPLAAVR